MTAGKPKDLNDETVADGEGAEPTPTPIYRVGHRCPPKHTQFKKGQSGNRNGRPKGRKSTTEVLMKELAARVTVGEGGVRRRMSMVEVIIKQLVNRAAKGDHKALQTIVLFERAAEAARAAKGTNERQSAHCDEADLRLIEKMLGLDGGTAAPSEPAAAPAQPSELPAESPAEPAAEPADDEDKP